MKIRLKNKAHVSENTRNGRTLMNSSSIYNTPIQQPSQKSDNNTLLNSHDSDYVTDRNPTHFQNIDIQDSATQLPFLESVNQALKLKNELKINLPSSTMEMQINSRSNSDMDDFDHQRIRQLSDSRLSEKSDNKPGRSRQTSQLSHQTMPLNAKISKSSSDHELMEKQFSYKRKMHNKQMDKFETKKMKNLKYDARIHLLDQKQFKQTIKLQKKMKRDVKTILQNQREEVFQETSEELIEGKEIIFANMAQRNQLPKPRHKFVNLKTAVKKIVDPPKLSHMNLDLIIEEPNYFKNITGGRSG